jgi:hypothetical protein
VQIKHSERKAHSMLISELKHFDENVIEKLFQFLSKLIFIDIIETVIENIIRKQVDKKKQEEIFFA